MWVKERGKLRWKIWNTSFQFICQKTQIYTQLVEFTLKHIVSKSIQKSIQHKRKVSSWRCYPNMLHDHFIVLPPTLGEKKRKKIYKVEKHHIYNTMTPIYTIIDSKKGNTHTQQYYLKTVQLKKEKSN